LTNVASEPGGHRTLDQADRLEPQLPVGSYSTTHTIAIYY